MLKRSEWEGVGHIADAERWYSVGEGSVSGTRGTGTDISCTGRPWAQDT